MTKFSAELSVANLPDAADFEVNIDLPEMDFGPLYERTFRRVQRLYMPLSHSSREKQVIDVVQGMLLRHLNAVMEYTLGELAGAEEPDLHMLHRQLLGLRKQAFQWDYTENDLGGSAHVVTSTRNMIFDDIAALHYLADQLVEDHRGAGCNVIIDVALKAKLPVPANKAKQFIMSVASKPFFDREGYTPFVTDFTVKPDKAKARVRRGSPEEE